MIAKSKMHIFKSDRLRVISLMIVAVILAQGIACCVAPPQIIVLKPTVNQFGDSGYEVLTVDGGRLTELTTANKGEYANVYVFLEGNSCTPGESDCNEQTYPLLKLGEWQTAQWIAMKYDGVSKITPYFGNTDPTNMKKITFDKLGNGWLYLYLFTNE